MFRQTRFGNEQKLHFLCIISEKLFLLPIKLCYFKTITSIVYQKNENYLILSFQQAGVLVIVELLDVDLRLVLQLGRLHRGLEDGGQVGQGELVDRVAVQRTVLHPAHPGHVAARTSNVNLEENLERSENYDYIRLV